MGAERRDGAWCLLIKSGDAEPFSMDADFESWHAHMCTLWARQGIARDERREAAVRTARQRQELSLIQNVSRVTGLYASQSHTTELHNYESTKWTGIRTSHTLTRRTLSHVAHSHTHTHSSKSIGIETSLIYCERVTHFHASESRVCMRVSDSTAGVRAMQLHA